MIRVRIEIVPHGDEAQARTIAEALIEHQQVLRPGRSSYKASFIEHEGAGYIGRDGCARIEHNHSEGVVRLLAMALAKARGKRR